MADGFQLREATVEDVPRLAELLIRMDAHVAGTSREVLEITAEGLRDVERRLTDLINNLHARVAVIGNRSHKVIAMGTIQIWHSPDFWANPERKGRVTGVIDDVWVEPKYRRRGLNRRLIKDLVTYAEQRGAQELNLEYSINNEEAAAAWSNLGFEPTGVRASASVATVRARLGKGSSRKSQEPKT